MGIGGSVADILITLGLDSSQFEKGMSKAEQVARTSTQKMADGFTKVGKSMMAIGGAMTLAITVPIVAFGKAAVQSASEAEAAIADLEAVIKSTGGAAGITSQAAQDYAKAMQQVTKFSDEEIIAGETILMQFTRLGKDVFPLASNAALDLAQRLGITVPAAAEMIGKALGNPAEGIGRLNMAFRMFNDTQMETIKKMAETGDIAGAQKMILEGLKKAVGGAAEAYGKTFAGQVAILNNQFDELKETIGKQLLPYLQLLINVAKDAINWFMNLPKFVQGVIVTFFALVAILPIVITGIGMLLFTIGQIITYGPMVISAISTIGSAIAGAGAISSIAFAPLIIALVVIIALVAGLAFVIWAFATDWMGVTTTLKQLFFIIGYEFDLMVQNMKTSWDQFRADFSAKSTQLKTTWSQLTFIIKYYWNQAITSIKSVFAAAWNYILGIFNNVKNAIISGIQSIIAAVQNLIRSILGIPSPSVHSSGGNVGGGLTARMAFNASGYASQSFAAVAPTNNINIRVGNMRNREDINYLAQEVARRITRQ